MRAEMLAEQSTGKGRRVNPEGIGVQVGCYMYREARAGLPSGVEV
jgi:hypothetical protein